MKQNKQTGNWWIDALMFVGYLLCFYLDLTDVIGHQWLGVGIGVLMVLHTWLHWDWVRAVTVRLLKGTNAKNRWYYLIDVLLLFGFIVILETGVVISTWLNLNLSNYPAWLDIHLYASYITLVLLVLKVGLHWRWVVNTTARIFSLNNGKMPAGRLAPVPVPVRTDKGAIDRRRFLGLMGVVGAGSVLAVANVVRANTLHSDTSDGNASAMGLTDQAAAQASATATSTTTVEKTSVATETATVAPEIKPIATATVEPTAAPTQAAATACQVRCPRGCAYPGHCRRYTDQNGNRLCDLGECL